MRRVIGFRVLSIQLVQPLTVVMVMTVGAPKQPSAMLSPTVSLTSL
jgi:hypothetical protein